MRHCGMPGPLMIGDGPRPNDLDSWAELNSGSARSLGPSWTLHHCTVKESVGLTGPTSATKWTLQETTYRRNRIQAEGERSSLHNGFSFRCETYVQLADWSSWIFLEGAPTKLLKSAPSRLLAQEKKKLSTRWWKWHGAY